MPIYAGELTDEDQRFAVDLDCDDAMRRWHRNGSARGGYAVRGCRRGNVYSDFLFAALRNGEGERIVAIETKGEQLAGNHDTEYKRALLERLSGAFRPKTADTGELALNKDAFGFTPLAFFSARSTPDCRR